MTMNYRPLGGTGIQVSVHCLGAMMFGAVGNPDHDDCARIIHAALDQGIGQMRSDKRRASRYEDFLTIPDDLLHSYGWWHFPRSW